MNQNQKKLLKTACLIRTHSFMEQEFDYFNLFKENPKLLNSLKDLNEYVLNLFLLKPWPDFEKNLNPSLGKAQQFLNLKFQDYFNCEIISCFWGNIQYGQDFKNPIHNWFNLNSTKQFHSTYFEVFSLIRNNPEFYAIYLQIQQLASCYDLAALSYRTQLELEGYLIPMYLKFSIDLQTLEYSEENLQDYYFIINLLTPTDTLKRGASSVLLQPFKHLSWSKLTGKDNENKLIEIQEGILYFQIPVGQNISFYQAFYSNYYALYLLLNKSITAKTWNHIDELEEILDFLSIKLTSKKNAHLKEKSTLVAYEALILEYFCMFKKAQYCVKGISEPNGFNQFLYDFLANEINGLVGIYKLSPIKYRDGLQSINLNFITDNIVLSLKHESIRKNLERRKKAYQPSQILYQENSSQDQLYQADLLKAIQMLGDYNFVER